MPPARWLPKAQAQQPNWVRGSAVVHRLHGVLELSRAYSNGWQPQRPMCPASCLVRETEPSFMKNELKSEKALFQMSFSIWISNEWGGRRGRRELRDQEVRLDATIAAHWSINTRHFHIIWNFLCKFWAKLVLSSCESCMCKLGNKRSFLSHLLSHPYFVDSYETTTCIWAPNFLLFARAVS